MERENSKEVIELLEPFIFEWVAEREGSISAEHGLGTQKNRHITLSKSKLAVKLMENLKDHMDPNRILNPYKTLP